MCNGKEVRINENGERSSKEDFLKAETIDSDRNQVIVGCVRSGYFE